MDTPLATPRQLRHCSSGCTMVGCGNVVQTLLRFSMLAVIGATASGILTLSVAETDEVRCERYRNFSVGVNSSLTNQNTSFAMIYINDGQWFSDLTLGVGDDIGSPLKPGLRCSINNIFIIHPFQHLRGGRSHEVAMESFRHPGFFVTATETNLTGCGLTRELRLESLQDITERQRNAGQPLENALKFIFSNNESWNTLDYEVQNASNSTQYFRVAVDQMLNGQTSKIRSLPLVKLLGDVKTGPEHNCSRNSTNQGHTLTSLSRVRLYESHTKLFNCYQENPETLCEHVSSTRSPGQCHQSCLFSMENSHCGASCKSPYLEQVRDGKTACHSWKLTQH
ncbi:uncharacterized protein LOC135822580 [Sycon ciliatum]|uniref:uncharacterized protein LOC135822580 n=1 Tax=Sycon ciliatum TaxID=27933 RepID=UPI0031F63708